MHLISWKAVYFGIHTRFSRDPWHRLGGSEVQFHDFDLQYIRLKWQIKIDLVHNLAGYCKTSRFLLRGIEPANTYRDFFSNSNTLFPSVIAKQFLHGEASISPTYIHIQGGKFIITVSDIYICSSSTTTSLSFAIRCRWIWMMKLKWNGQLLILLEL